MADATTDQPSEDERIINSLLGQAVAEPRRTAASAVPVQRSVTSLLGSALGGGSAGIPLSPQEQEDAGGRALLNFGINMLANSGYSTDPKTFGQIFAQGIAGAQESLGRSGEVASARATAQQEYEKTQQELRIARIKEALPLLNLRDQIRRANAADALVGGSKPNTNIGAAGAPTAGGQSAEVPPELMPAYQTASAETGIPVAVLIAKDKQESGFNNSLRGGAGEIGIAQVLPSTAAAPGYGIAGVSKEELAADPGKNILFGARYLAARAKAAGVTDWNNPDQVAKALTAYNGGGDPKYAEHVMRYLPKPGAPATAAAAPAAPGAPAAPAPAPAAPAPKQATGGQFAGPGAPAAPAEPPPSPGAAANAEAIKAGMVARGADPATLAAGPGVPGAGGAQVAAATTGATDAAPPAPGSVAAQTKGLVNPNAPPAPGGLGGATLGQPETVTTPATGAAPPPATAPAGPPPVTPPPPSLDTTVYPDIVTAAGRVRHPGPFQAYFDANAQPPPTTEDFNPKLSQNEMKGFASEQNAINDARRAYVNLPRDKKPEAAAAILQRQNDLNTEIARAQQKKEETAAANLTKWRTTQIERLNPRWQDEAKAYTEAARAQQDNSNQIALEGVKGNETRQTEWAKIVGKQTADAQADVAKEIDSINKTLHQTVMLRALSDAAPANSPLESVNVAGMNGRDLMVQLGLGDKATKQRWAAQQAFEAAAVENILNLRSGVQMGQLSDRDLAFLQKSGVNLMQSPEARSTIIAYIDQMKIQRRDFLQDIQARFNEGKAGITWTEAVRQAQKAERDILPSPLPKADPNRKDLPATSFDQWTPAQQDAWAAQIGPDGKPNLRPYQLFRDNNGNMNMYVPPGSPERKKMEAEAAARAAAGGRR